MKNTMGDWREDVGEVIVDTALATSEWITAHKELLITLGEMGVIVLLAPKIVALGAAIKAATIASALWMATPGGLAAGVIAIGPAAILATAAIAGLMAAKLGAWLADATEKASDFSEAVIQTKIAMNSFKTDQKRALLEISTRTGVLVTTWKELDAAVDKGVLRFSRAEKTWIKWTPIIDEIRETTEKTKKALADYAGEIDNVGDKYLQLAGARFAEGLKAEGAGILQLHSTMLLYRAEIEKTYQARRNMHQGIFVDLAKEGAEQEKLQAAKIAQAKSQLAMNEELLASYQGYYDSLAALQGKHIKARMAKLKELADFEKSTLKVSQEIDELIAAEKRALLGETQSEEEQYYNTVTQLDKQYADALKATGAERLTALDAYITAVRSAAEASENIRTGDPWEGSGLVGDTALERMEQAQSEWGITKEAITATMQESAAASQTAAQGIQQALDMAAKSVDSFLLDVQVMAAELEDLKANIVVTLDDQASFAIGVIRDELATLQDRTITITTRKVTEAASSGGDSPEYYGDGGYVSGPTLAVIGEKGPEWIVPDRKMRQLTTQSNDNRQDNRVSTLNVNYYGDQPGSRIERDFEMQQMFQNMQREADASITQ